MTERRGAGFFSRHRDELVVAVLALSASLAGLSNDFVYDDLPLIRDNARVHGLSHWRDLFTQPYWPPPFVEQLYRPVTLLMAAFEWSIGGGAPMTYRLVSYALYAAGAVLVYRLASRLLARPVALAVAVLFAVHPVHVEAVALGVNQGELLLGMLAALCVAHYIDRRRGDGLRALDWAMLAAACAVAALTKENGFALAGLLLAAEVLPLDARSARERTRALWPGFLGLVAVGACVLALRNYLLPHDAITVVTAPALEGHGPFGRMYAMLQVVPMWLRLFAWPARLQVDFAPGEIPYPTRFGLWEFAGLALLAAAAVAVLRTWRRRPVFAFGVLWCAAALLPVSNIIPTGIMLAERTLYVPSIGFVMAVGAAAEWTLERWPARRVRNGLVALGLTLAVLGIVRSGGRQSVWNSAHIVVSPR